MGPIHPCHAQQCTAEKRKPSRGRVGLTNISGMLIHRVLSLMPMAGAACALRHGVLAWSIRLSALPRVQSAKMRAAFHIPRNYESGKSRL